MIVTQDMLSRVIDSLCQEKILGFDTETYGLRVFDKLFSIILTNGTEEGTYYFNYHDYEDGSPVLPRESVVDLQRVFEDRIIVAHNAKFDLHRLLNAGLNPTASFYCTLIGERIAYNTHMLYGLDACAKRIGHRKDDAVEEYIKKRKNKAYTMVEVPGKSTKQKNKHYHKVPLELVHPYGEKDALLTLELYHAQQERLRSIPIVTKRVPDINNTVDLEMQLIPVLTKMERRGMKISRDFTIESMEATEKRVAELKQDFAIKYGEQFIDSNQVFARVFEGINLKYPTTTKGNPSFSKDVLKKLNHEIGGEILEIRQAIKSIGTYYSSFLHHADSQGIIRANIRQTGTTSGRMSYSDPNLQQQTKKDSGTYRIRRCFVPRPGYNLVMIDYDQQEFRMMLDRAGEIEVINDILGGKDVHQATADMVGVSRDQAKTVNFGLLYGMGTEKLGVQLGISTHEAWELKARYFQALPRVKSWIQRIRNLGERIGFVQTWNGRVLRCDAPEFSYKMPNHVIQGGCADVVKIAMLKCDAILEGTNSHMLAQVHDELLFEIREEDMSIIPDLKEAMENIYVPKNGMKLTCSVEWSDKSWADKEVYHGC